MNHLPLVTISIPTYNQSRYIRRAVESALGQDYPNLEVVVADDRSPDDTFAVASAISDPRLRVVCNARNLGRIGNYRHMLYALARGEWVVNLDGDDWYDDAGFVSRAVSCVTGQPGVVLYAAGARSFVEATGEYQTAPMRLDGDLRTLSGVDYVLGYPQLGATQHFAVLYNAAQAREVGFYQLDSLGTDTDSLCRLALTGDVVVERRYVGVWTEHESNASYTLTSALLAKEVAMVDHIAAALAQHVPEPVWRPWRDSRVRWKTDFVILLELARLPYAQAWRRWGERAGLDRFTLKEAVKLLVRPIRRRRR